MLMLSGYDVTLSSILLSGFSFGFSLHYKGIRPVRECRNLLSAIQHPDIVDKKLAKELAALRIDGPYALPPFHDFCVSPIGVVPKKLPGEFRLIHHLSFPPGSSVNDGIPEEDTSVHYATIGDAIRLIKRSGRGCFLAKTDIKNAFRIIPINPNDYPLLGIKWRGLYFFDKCMPMGCSSSCKTFELFSSAIQWIAQHRLKLSNIIHLLDDFLFVALSYNQCETYLHHFSALCSYLGIPLAPEKTMGPATTLSFAGIELDSLAFEARLPADKLQKCVGLITEFLGRKKVTLKELQSLIGLLNFTCSVIVPGRAFLRRLIDLTRGLSKPHHYVRLCRRVKDDLRVWLSFLSSFNGKSFFLNDIWCDSHQLNLFTDASAAIGSGAIFGSEWCYGERPADWKYRNIAVLEFYPIVLSICLWGHKMSNQSVLIFTDNESLVHVINKQSCRDTSLMFFVRKLVLHCLRHNIRFKARHVPGIDNKLADCLSRFQVSQFKQLAPSHMSGLPTAIPPDLQPGAWPM